MNVESVMHKQAGWASADTPVREVARMMAKDDIGAVPIGRDDRLVGMLTDRDIALRVVAEGLDPNTTRAEQVMTKSLIYCRTTEAIEDAIRLMEARKVRRLPVLDENKRLVGMLSLGDVAHSAGRQLTGELLQAVSDHHD
ncbi:CBS domain-containing protein [Paracoccus benzoatiresistens]|uniref:CBS domain-containing protein n=1 Tax=Paracoccus benzoatiresistens TaxID=2997341 RepID=A0ABT4JCI9_9RHOB|nr:CBS domain-containing protein [Paracoccus sp. EF6]MCZ0964058.1 CBS domain-containing protein [Paracoccus sp. EF6]